jgi:hypothetical protein
MSASVYVLGRRLTRCAAFGAEATVGGSHRFGLVRGRGFGSGSVDGNSSSSATLSTTITTTAATNSVAISTTSTCCRSLDGSNTGCGAFTTSVSRAFSVSTLNSSGLSTEGNNPGAEVDIIAKGDGSDIGYRGGDWYRVDNSCTSNNFCADIRDSLSSGFGGSSNGLNDVPSCRYNDGCKA